MPTHYVIKAIFAGTLFLASCGTKDGAHYPESDKIFNRQTEDQTPPDNPVVDDDDGGFDGGEPDPRDDGGGDTGGDPQPAPTPDPGGGHDGGADGSDDSGDDGNDDGDTFPPLPDPETMISHTRYRTRFDHQSVRKLIDRQSPIMPGRLMYRRAAESLYNHEDDSFISGQNFGDGVSRSRGFQTIISRAGDDQSAEGEASASGQQFYDRVTGLSGCPNTFVCVTRTWFVPERGNGATVCFHDPETMDLTPVPYAPVASYREQDFDDAIGDWGPYLAVRYDGPEVDCRDPGQSPILEESILASIARGVSETVFEFQPEPLAIDFGIDLFYSRLEDDDVAPYLDQTVLLQKETQFKINSRVAEYAKIILTLRFPLRVPLTRISGLQVEAHAELCENYLTDSTFCTH